jgi:hypothetical protein
MDRETLRYLLRSGKFLCYNPAALARDATDLDPPVAAEAPCAPCTAAAEGDGSVLAVEWSADAVQHEGEPPPGGALPPRPPPEPPPPLFDSPYLAAAVFFKEAQADDGDEEELRVSTRVMLPFNAQNAHEGGASVDARPDLLESALEKWYGGRAQVALSPHDRAVLDVFCRTPTFDPFLLLAQRAEIERERKVDPAGFAIDGDAAKEVRAIIHGRAAALVGLALGDDAKPARVKATIDALETAIWTCTANDRTGRLFRSLGVPADKTDRILFAWKGIAYYEYLFRGLGADYADFLVWLRGPDSMPKDLKTLESRRADAIRSLRRRGQEAMRQYYGRATGILKQHAEAYDALLVHGNPQPFQKFLLAAPTLFETLGMSIGAFGHASNAWKTLTNHGRRPSRKADALEAFYRFVVELGVD